MYQIDYGLVCSFKVLNSWLTDNILSYSQLQYTYNHNQFDTLYCHTCVDFIHIPHFCKKCIYLIVSIPVAAYLAIYFAISAAVRSPGLHLFPQ